jgi:hypothetical protein
MASPDSKPSFSPGRRWAIGVQVLVVLLVVLSVVVMLNLLSRDHPLRLHLSTRTRLELSPHTRTFLHSMTNRVRVTLYYDKQDPLYSTLVDLLDEYKDANPRISVQTVDYLRDVGPAEKVKAQYTLGTATNTVIFDCEGGAKVPVPSSLLEDTEWQQVGTGKQMEFRRKPIAFKGEMAFTATLLAVTTPDPPKAYFLTGHGEHSPESTEIDGYSTFASVLKQNNIKVDTLTLLGTNQVPGDCNLLVIAGPRNAMLELELDKIAQYLAQGGRLLALFNVNSLESGRASGLEKILAGWGVAVGENVIIDAEHSSDLKTFSSVVISAFSRHPLVNPLINNGLVLFYPRTVGKFPQSAEVPNAARVDEVAFTGTNAYIAWPTNAAPVQRRLPVMVAVERTPIKGVITERGTTRMVVAGDSSLLANRQLGGSGLANRDFAELAANWLLDRTQMFGSGLSPQRLDEYTIEMTKIQMQQAEIILLAGMPGAVLFLGGLVWLRRRR